MQPYAMSTTHRSREFSGSQVPRVRSRLRERDYGYVLFEVWVQFPFGIPSSLIWTRTQINTPSAEMGYNVRVYIWPSRLLARTLPSQGRKRGIETPLGHQICLCSSTGGSTRFIPERLLVQVQP